MGVRSVSRLDVAGDAAAVYDYLADVALWPEWAAAILECRVSGGAPLQAGSRLEQRVKGAFGSRSRTLDVSAADAPQRLVFSGMMGPSPMRWGFDIAASGTGRVGVELWLEAETRGLMRAMPGGLIRRMVARVSGRELVAIKSAVESGQRAPSSQAR